MGGWCRSNRGFIVIILSYFFRLIYCSSPISAKPHITHDLLGTPADTRMVSTIRATVTFAFRLGWYRSQIVTFIFAQGAAFLTVLPEVAVATVFRLLRGIYSFAQSKNLQSFRFAHLILGIKKSDYPAPAKGRIIALCNRI